jgi:DNA-binding protein HU-beta
VTKADLIQEVADRTGFDKNDMTIIIETFFKVVKDKMADGNNIYVRGFGSFINKRRAAKVGRNISQNAAIHIPEHYIPSFKPSKSFVDVIKKSDKVKEANKS